jgi:hypothetical protein
MLYIPRAIYTQKKLLTNKLHRFLNVTALPHVSATVHRHVQGVKVKVPRNRPEGPEVYLYSFLTSALERGVVSTTPRPLYPQERPGTHWTGGWVGPRAGVDVCEKSRPPTGFDPRTVQPVASRYTDWAIRPTCSRSIDTQIHTKSCYKKCQL